MSANLESFPSAMASKFWWHQPFRMFQTNLREVDAGKLDVAQVLDFIQDFGANAWLLSVGGIISGYPSALEYQTPNPGLAERSSGDLVGDAIVETRRRGVKLLARMDFSKVDHRVAHAHPDWCFVDPQGNHQTYNGVTSVCPSGPYYQEKVFEILDEVLSRYSVDGFFFNWLTYNEVDYEKTYRGVCQCMSCKRAFAVAAPGQSLPLDRNSPSYMEWQRFAASMLDDWTARARDFIADRRPEAPLMMMGTASDIFLHEANNAVDRPLWHHLCTEHVSAAKTYRPGTPVLVNATAFVDMPYRLAGEEPHAYAQYLVQAMARGANPSIYIMGTPDQVQYECLDVARELIQFHRDHEDVYRGYRSCAQAALVRPDGLKSGGTLAAEAQEEFYGLWSALIERHVPLDILAEEHISELGAAGELSRYRLIILPDLGVLDSSAVRLLDDFVRGGGRLLTTGSSGFDSAESQLASLGHMARKAVKNGKEATWSVHLVPDSSPLGRPAYPMPLIGAYHLVEPPKNSTTGMSTLSAAPYGPPEKCYGHLPLDHPGWVAQPYGLGSTLCMPWTIGRAYRTLGLSAYRDTFIDEVVGLLGADLHIETDLPEQVEIVVATSEAGWVIHLRNLSGASPQRFGAPLSIAPSRLTFRVANRAPRRAHGLVAGADLVCTTNDDGSLTIDLPCLNLFEVVVLT